MHSFGLKSEKERRKREMADLTCACFMKMEIVLKQKGLKKCKSCGAYNDVLALGLEQLCCNCFDPLFPTREKKARPSKNSEMYKGLFIPKY